MRRYLFVVILLTLFIGDIGMAKTSTIDVRRDRALLRKGPGSFYEVIAAVPKGTVLDTMGIADAWFKVRFREKTGFVSKKVTLNTAPQKDVFSRMAFHPAALKLSAHGMAAGAKGFAMRFSKRINGDRHLIDRLSAYQLDPILYEQFRNETYQNQNPVKLHRRFPLPETAVRSDYSIMEEGIGLGIASKIGALKLYDNKMITDYINLVGNLLVEASPGYDLSFKFFVIDQPFVNAFACPSGYIFITKGLLQFMKNEGELAAVLGHEIAHVVYQHGLKELEKRKPIIIAEDAFSQLNSELPKEKDDGFQKVEDELDDFALAVYETIFSGRLSQYEFEADRYGMIFAARCGYRPGSMADLLDRMVRSHSVSSNDHYTPEQNQKRLSHLKNVLNSNQWKGNFNDFQNRWESYMKHLK
jgi:Peptidase family M48